MQAAADRVAADRRGFSLAAKARPALLSLLAVGCALGSAVASADVWRWVDRTGRVHYSDVPIEGAVRIKSEVRKPETAASGSMTTPASAPGAGANASVQAAAGAQPSLASRSAAISERLATETAERAVEGDLARKRAEQCKEATERYDRSIAARRLYRDGKSGERVYLTDAEIAQARLDARRDRDAACTGGAMR